MVSVTTSISGPNLAFSTSGIGVVASTEKSPGLTFELCYVVYGLILHSLKHFAISSLQKNLRPSSIVFWSGASLIFDYCLENLDINEYYAPSVYLQNCIKSGKFSSLSAQVSLRRTIFL